MLPTFHEKEQELLEPDEGRLISFPAGALLELAPVAARFNASSSSAESTINRPLNVGVGAVVDGAGGSVGSTGCGGVVCLRRLSGKATGTAMMLLKPGLVWQLTVSNTAATHISGNILDRERKRKNVNK